MDINEVKALIRSLVVTSTTPYSVHKLMRDFEEEAGIRMPIYNFSTPKAFLKTLTDTIQFVGQPPYEKIRPVQNEKTQHIASLVKRQGRMGRCRGEFSHPDLYLSENIFKGENPQVPNKKKSNGTSLSQVNTKNERLANNVKSSKNHENIVDDNVEDFIFKEEEISSISKCPGISPAFRHVSTSKTKECDDISETGSRTSSNNSSSSCYVNDGVKAKLKKLMKNQTEGIWCCDLPDLYKNRYKFSLEFKELGYRSLIDMVMELTEIFRCVRPGNGDWLLFDASKPPSEEEMNIHAVSHCTIPEEVERNLLELIECHCANSSKAGIYLEDLLVLYFKKFRRKLNFINLGFPNVKSLLSKLDGQILRLEKDGSRFIIKPVVEQNVVNQETAVLPITPEDDVFTELFPADVVKRGENFATLNIGKYFVVGEKIEVNVADVWSPDKFYVQLKQYEQEFTNLSQNLQVFYNRNTNKYKMPKSTIQPNQVCVGLYSNEDVHNEWHRSVIIKITKQDEVLVDFVDYGNRVRMDTGNLRFLHRDFFDLPVQSYAAKLSYVRPVNGHATWPLETCKRFLELVTVPGAEFQVKSIDAETQMINGAIISINGNTRINVGKALIKEGMAVHDRKKVEEFTSRETSLENMNLNDKGVVEESQDNKVESDLNGNNEKKAAVSDISTSVEESLAVEYKARLWDISAAAQNASSLRLDRDVYALAFWLLSTNDFVKQVASTNLDIGLQAALNLARNLSEMTGVTFYNWK